MTFRRTHRPARTLLVAVVVACLFVPASLAQAAPTAAEIAAQVRALDAEVATASRAYESAYWRLHETEVRMDNLEAAIAQTEAELAVAEAAFGVRAGAMYRRDDQDVISFILTSQSFLEMATRAMLWERITNEDARVVNEANRLREEYEIELAAIDTERSRQQSDVDALRNERDAIEAQFRSKQAEYNELQRKLEAAIAAEAARNRVTYVAPTTANGMTFPVAGPNHYSDTWGASRSGGRRRHQGTDIMAARGTPLVAVMPGTVRASSSSLGGITIWLTADNGWQFYYAHMDSRSVTSGHVSQGQVIGTVGSTGNASYTAPHLHFEIHPGGGSAVNPYPYLRAMQGY